MIYQQGSSTSNEGSVTSIERLQPGHEYIFEYQTPAFAYSFISTSTVERLIRTWIDYRPTGGEDPVLFITGVYIDTETGRVKVRATVLPSTNVKEAGINPLAVLGVIAGLFAVIGVGVSLLYVYEVATPGSGSSTPGIDPCSQSGIRNSISCFAKTTKLVGTGVLIGAVIILLLVLFAAKKGAV